MKLTFLKGLATSTVLALTATGAFATECIAPANAGGGWDFTCRQIGKLLYDLKQVDAPVAPLPPVDADVSALQRTLHSRRRFQSAGLAEAMAVFQNRLALRAIQHKLHRLSLAVQMKIRGQRTVDKGQLPRERFWQDEIRCRGSSPWD